MKQLPVFQKLQQEAANGNDESEDIAKGLARVFAEVAEAYVSLIAAGEHKLPSYWNIQCKVACQYPCIASCISNSIL